MLLRNKRFIAAWNIVVVVATTFMALYLPLEVVFGNEVMRAFLIPYYIASLVLITDVIFNIRLNRNHDPNSIFADSIGIRPYLQKWFIIDLIAALPIGIFFPGSVWELIRLVKVAKVISFLNEMLRREIRFNSALTLTMAVYIMLLITHWLACGWMVLREDLYPVLDPISSYIRGIYWTVTTLTTVGYGDITPTRNAEILYAVLVEFLGIGFYGFLIGNIANILSRKDPARIQYEKNIEQLGALIQYRNLPVQLQRRIRDYYAYLWSKRLGFDESSFLEGLPGGLQLEVSLYLKQSVVNRIPLFQGTEDKFISEVALRLEPMICTPGDYIFREGEEGHEMFFVIQGELEVINSRTGEVLTVMGPGEFFGEVALFLSQRRSATIRAKTYCDLYKLGRETFDRIVENYPAIAREIEQKARYRSRKQ